VLADSARAEPAYDLKHDTPVDLGVTVGGFGFVAFTEAMKPALAPDACRWCDRDAEGRDTLNGLDRAARSLRWSNARYAAATSDASAFLATPVAGIAGLALAASADGERGHIARDALLVAESAAVAGVATQLVKFSVGRERPYAHDRAGLRFRASPDQNLSFLSGHTSLAFSIATAAGTVASLRDYRGAPFVWLAAMPIAVLTGYLRIAADKHYLTDVLAGAIVGAAAGVVVPLAFHGREAPAPAPAGASPAPPSGAPAVLTLAW
jgi:membrane-associated phospholipid phosphatase